MKLTLTALLLMLASPAATAQAVPPAEPAVADAAKADPATADPYSMVTFTFKPLTGKSWIITSFGNGGGVFFYAVEGAKMMPLHFTAATTAKLASGRTTIETRKCETRAKNIAKTGAKRLVLGLGPNAMDCEFNYSDDPGINAAVEAFRSVAETVQAGERLQAKKRFDHLGLDAELDALTAEAKDGRAIELQNIAPILESIVEDEEMMTMVRKKAANLLELVSK